MLRRILRRILLLILVIPRNLISVSSFRHIENPGSKDQLPYLSRQKNLSFDTSRSTYIMPMVPRLLTYFSKPSCDGKYLTLDQTSIRNMLLFAPELKIIM